MDGTEGPADPRLSFSLEQIVTGAPGGDVRYWVTIEEGAIKVGTTPRPSDATIRLDFRTAVDLATGKSTAGDAFQAGLVKFSGDLSRMEAATAAFAGLGQILARRRDETTFPT